ncbi:MAG: hypothetical protein J6K42_05010 [Clostridia bacterium]|nr:hypothetical protein [Clostridia bacterium]
MFYQNLYIKNNITIPQPLLQLFIYYQKDIIKQSTEPTCIFILNESSEEYIITNKILNTIKPSKSFNETLFNYIDHSNFTDVEVYKKAFIDRRLFSQIKSDAHYHPSFGTITLLALALELSTIEYEALLNSASYSLPQNTYINITLKYCFDNKIYDITKVNNLIYAVSDKQIRDL